MSAERETWLKRAPFMGAMMALIGELAGMYGSTTAALESTEFVRRMDAIADATPGVVDWLAEMPA